MTPKEKAKQLVDKMYAVHSNSASDITYYFAKQCALIAVDEIIKSNYKVLSGVKPSFYDYWIEVQQEIEKL
jgi:hypothetical protein